MPTKYHSSNNGYSKKAWTNLPSKESTTTLPLEKNALELAEINKNTQTLSEIQESQLRESPYERTINPSFNKNRNVSSQTTTLNVNKNANHEGNFNDQTKKKLLQIAPYTKWYASPGNSSELQQIDQIASLMLTGEEYNDRKGMKSVMDTAQDTIAKLGLFNSRYKIDHSKSANHEQELKNGVSTPNRIKMMLFQSPELNDIGPANIKVKTMADLTGTTSAEGLNELSRLLLTDKGTAGSALRVAKEARKDLGNLLQTVNSDRERAAIMVNRMREGPAYWDRVRKARDLSEDDLRKWKLDPENFRKADGTKPAPLTPPEAVKFNYDLVDQVLKDSHEALDRKPLGH